MKRNMKNKLLAYGILPVMALVLLGIGTASAHGMWGMNMATPEEIATRQQNMFTEQANLLGVSVDEVKNAWAQGKTIEQLAQEKGITTEQFRQKMAEMRTAQLKDQLKTLVDKGIITQAQADQRTTFITQKMQTAKTNKGMGHGFGHGRWF